MIRESYLQAAASAASLLADPGVAEAWDAPSALTEFSVRGLAGHLATQVFYVTRLLEAEHSDVQPLSVAEFFARARAFDVDVDAEISRRIRQGGEAAADVGAIALVREVESAIGRQRAALAAEPGDRVVVAMGARPILLDDFLLTRMLEIVVHSDDLAVSVGLSTPLFAPAVFEPVLDLLSRLAVVRHGQTAVLRALSRAERAPDTIAAI